jgi:hypothetical protein
MNRPTTGVHFHTIMISPAYSVFCGHEIPSLIRSAPNTKRKSAIYTWDAVNEKIPGPAK